MCLIKYHWIAAEFFHAGRPGQIESIILHATEGHIGGDIPTLVGGDGRSVSVHWYVTKKGEYYHFVQDADIANHAGAVSEVRYNNAHSIGIEQEGIPQTEPWPSVQIQATANLVAFLFQKHGTLEIISHAKAAVPPGRKSDPEPYPWAEFNTMLAEAQKQTWEAMQV